MREAIGSSMLLNIVLVIVGIISLFLINSITYSKAFKVKSRIISVIEKYNGICTFQDDDGCYNEIEEELTNMGYSSNISSECKDPKQLVTDDVVYKKDSGIYSVDLVYSTNNSGHKYCVYKYTLCSLAQNGSNSYTCFASNKYYFYKVVAFMHYDIPFIENFLEFEVSGETRTFNEYFLNLRSY